LTQKIWQYNFSVISKKILPKKNGKKSQNFGSQKIGPKKKKKKKNPDHIVGFITWVP
jgi:hypothetical protein